MCCAGGSCESTSLSVRGSSEVSFSASSVMVEDSFGFARGIGSTMVPVVVVMALPDASSGLDEGLPCCLDVTLAS